MVMRRIAAGLAGFLVVGAAIADVEVHTGADGRKVFTNTPSVRVASRPATARSTPSTRPARSASPAAIALVSRDELDSLIEEHSGRNRLDPDLVRAVIRAESGFNPRAVSSKGAMGLMQLMPATAADLDVDDAFDPESNIDGGTRYLRQMFDEFEGQIELALAGYNAGPNAVRHYGGIPPFAETRRYVERVLRDYRDDFGYRLPTTAASSGGRKVYMSRDSSGKLVLSTFGDG